MNEDPGKRRASNMSIAVIVTISVLLAFAVAWVFWIAVADDAAGLPLATANSRPADAADVRAQAAATAKMLQSTLSQRATGGIEVTSDGATGSLSTIRAGLGGDLFPQVTADRPPEVKVAAFLAEHGGLLGIDDPARQLKLLGVEQDQYGHRHVSYQQMHGTVRVLGAVLKGHVTPDGRLTAINGKFIPGIAVPTRPDIGKGEANAAAIARVGQQQPAAVKDTALSVKSASLIVYRTNLTRGTAGANHLAYEVQVVGGSQVREFVYIDATTGKVIDQITGIHGAKNRWIYEAHFDPANPGIPPPAWREGDARPAVDPAHEDEVASAGHSYNLFFNLSGGTHRSWNGNDARMYTVNNDPTIVCPNANWNGTSTNYCSGTSADDVVAHEWTHAYTQETSGLIYAWQTGALNESYSDVFGETVDLINNRETLAGTTPATGHNGPRSQDDEVCSSFASEIPTGDESVRWLMGEDAFAFLPLPPIGDAAIRDMWRPRCAGGIAFLGNPGHVTSDLYSCSADDAGGVHTNSAVNNRAYALLVDGDTVELKDDGTPFENPVTVTGIGLTKAAHIFWRANSVYNGPASNFVDNADALEMACADLVGRNLTKLFTDAESGTGFLGANDDNVHPAPELSGEIITPADCQQVTNAIAAVEMRTDVTKQCGFEPLLDPAPAPMCASGTVQSKFLVDWESGIPAGWTVGQTPATKTQLDTRPWFLRSGDLPANPNGSPRPGKAMFQENRIDLGNCTTDDESGVLFLTSPPIVVDAASPSQMMFEHYVATEGGYDGGNVLISINGGPFEIVPGTAFVHNAYPGALNGIVDQNTNPKAGEEAYSGTNPNEQTGDWGQSQIDLAAAGAAPGDTIQLRWEFGQDGCNGNDGWYLDRVQVFSCGSTAPPPAQECTAYPADIPLPSPITSLLASSTTATVSGQSSPVSDVNIRNLEGSHPYMGDLTFSLRSPSGRTRTLFNGAACAGEDGISAEFDDSASQVIGCGDWLSGGSFKPFEALSAFQGETANGDWTLTVSDAVPRDEGTLGSWSLELCRDLPCAGEKATGSGWLAAGGNAKINFGFNVSQKDSGPVGGLQLSDKSAGIKIDLKTVESIGAVQGMCGAIGESDHAIEIRGSGIFGKNTPANFRACVEDNGDGKKHGGGLADRFHLECTSGCNYSTAARALDDKLDNGNLQVTRKCSGTASVPPEEDEASTLILNPVLMTEGLLGATQVFEVSVFGSAHQPLPGRSVSLTSASANGAVQTLTAIANASGKALFNVPIATQPREYEATSNDVGSNAVHVTPLF